MYTESYPQLVVVHSFVQIYLIGWVAVQYHWTLDESVPYLGESEGRAKYKQDESNVQWYWTATHPMRNLLYIVHHPSMIINLLPVCSSSHPISLNIGQFAVVLWVYNKEQYSADCVLGLHKITASTAHSFQQRTMYLITTLDNIDSSYKGLTECPRSTQAGKMAGWQDYSTGKEITGPRRSRKVENLKCVDRSYVPQADLFNWRKDR